MAVLLMLVATCVLSGQDAAPRVPPPAAPGGRALWKVSLTSLAAANAADVASSWGKRELNPLLANPAGRFGAQGVAIKLALQGSLFGVEYLLTRGRPTKKLYRVLTVVNLGAAAGVGSLAVRNCATRGPSR